MSLAHPSCVDILLKAAREDGAAAARREEKKVEKYQSKVLPGGFIKPQLCATSYGPLRSLGQRSTDILVSLIPTMQDINRPQDFKC